LTFTVPPGTLFPRYCYVSSFFFFAPPSGPCEPRYYSCGLTTCTSTSFRIFFLLLGCSSASPVNVINSCFIKLLGALSPCTFFLVRLFVVLNPFQFVLIIPPQLFPDPKTHIWFNSSSRCIFTYIEGLLFGFSSVHIFLLFLILFRCGFLDLPPKFFFSGFPNSLPLDQKCLPPCSQLEIVRFARLANPFFLSCHKILLTPPRFRSATVS